MTVHFGSCTSKDHYSLPLLISPLSLLTVIQQRRSEMCLADNPQTGFLGDGSVPWGHPAGRGCRWGNHSACACDQEDGRQAVGLWRCRPFVTTCDDVNCGAGWNYGWKSLVCGHMWGKLVSGGPSQRLHVQRVCALSQSTDFDDFNKDQAREICCHCDNMFEQCASKSPNIILHSPHPYPHR